MSTYISFHVGNPSIPAGLSVANWVSVVQLGVRSLLRCSRVITKEAIQIVSDRNPYSTSDYKFTIKKKQTILSLFYVLFSLIDIWNFSTQIIIKLSVWMRDIEKHPFSKWGRESFFYDSRWVGECCVQGDCVESARHSYPFNLDGPLFPTTLFSRSPPSCSYYHVLGTYLYISSSSSPFSFAH